MPAEPLNQRFVVQLSASELAAITAYGHDQRIFGRSEAARRILAAGFDALGIAVGEQTPATTVAAAAAPIADDQPAPPIPQPDDCGRPVLGEIILPWLRAQGRREYEIGEVLEGAFGATASQPGRDKTVELLFKAIGWKAHTSRRGGVTRKTFTAPV